MSAPAFRQALGAALACLNAGNLDAASAACDTLSRALPEDPAVLQLQATIALRRDQAAEALDSIQRSLKIRPGHVPSLMLAAKAAASLGQPRLAIPHLREAVARAPDLAEPAFLLCRTLLEINDPSLQAALQMTAAGHPSRAMEWQQLGLALQRAQRPAEALASLTRAAKADATLAGAHYGIGLLLRDAGRLVQAQTSLQRAVSLDPAGAAAWFALGLTCQDLGNEADAAAAFQAALRGRPDFAEAAVNFGISLQRLGDMAGALEAYRTAIRIRPDTFSRVAQAVTTAHTGMLWLDPAAFRRALGA